ncbi:MAG: hypothetical protein CFE21_03095 [Bacteroidetes bacterium B1(2017)]|nr:MAG: hypothetical protein CFE21_03095 [Bacteroidetes bacterium B1(2017)]
MKKLTIKIAVLLFASTQVHAQERSAVYTNLLNPFLYNAATAGVKDNINTVFNTISNVGGMDGSPRSYNFSINCPIQNTMGIGAKVITNSVGAFKTTNLEGVYSKWVKLDKVNSVNFGISLGFTQTNLKTELLNGQVDMSDPTLNAPNLNKMMLSSGAGAYYRYGGKGELGLSMPALVTGNQPMNNMLIANAAWNFFKGDLKQWKIRPSVSYYHLNTSPSMFDVLLGGAYKNTISLSGGYRSNGSILAIAGLTFKDLSVHYAYYKHLDGFEALAPAKNEIALSFGFNKPKMASKERNGIVSDEVIQDEIDKLNERLNGLISVQKTNPGLVNMKKEISKLNKDLDKVLGKYKITNPEQIQKIKTLQATIESEIAKYND